MEMEKLLNDLKELGLTEGEAKVYLALLTGETTKSGIVKRANISPSIVYEILNKLMKKGLVSSIVVEGKKYFQANNPRILLDWLDSKRKLAENLVSMLKQIKNESILFARVYEGLDGLKSMLMDVEKEEFEKNGVKEWLAMGVTSYKKDSFNRFWIYWHSKVRPKYKVRAKFIFSEKNTRYFKAIKKTPLTEIKLIPLSSPTCITITGGSVLIMKYTEPPSFILIKNKDVAETFKGIFESLWENC